MIVVDTSVWIQFFRGGADTATVAAGLKSLIDEDKVALVAPIRVELLGGARFQDATRLKRDLSALPLWIPTVTTWDTVEAWAELGARKGHHFGVGNLLIAATAAERDAAVWSLDSDFDRMRRLGLGRRYGP